MNEDHEQLISKSKPARQRRYLFLGLLAAVLYIGSYLVDSYTGGYWGELERDGYHRYTVGLSMPTATLWQPRFGYWAPYRSDFLGKFYLPLIKLDQHFLHRTRYPTDSDFFDWVKTAPVSDWHPRFRDEVIASRKKGQ